MVGGPWKRSLQLRLPLAAGLALNPLYWRSKPEESVKGGPGNDKSDAFQTGKFRFMKAYGERTILDGLICPHYSILNLDGLSPYRGSPVKTTSQLPLTAYNIGDVT